MAKRLKHARYLTFLFLLRSGRRRNDKKNYVFELEIRKKKVWKTSLGDDGCA